MGASVPAARLISTCCAVWALLFSGQLAAYSVVPWSEETGSTRALLVAADGATAAELDRVAEVLQHAYGTGSAGIVRMFGEAARTDDIERHLVDLAMRAGPRDTLIVVLALAPHDRGQDRVLMTSDFDPERPWSGLSLDFLQKASAGSSTGNLWLFVPGCMLATKGDVERYSQMPNANVRVKSLNSSGGNYSGGRAMITFCESDGTSPGRRFVQVLARALDDSAQSASKRGIVDHSGVTGTVTADELLSRLIRAGEGIEFHADASIGGGAVLRVRISTADANASELRNSLDTAADDEAAIGVLDRAVKSARSAKDPANALVIADVLTNYTMDTSVSMTRRVRAIQAIGVLPAAAARPALERIFATAGNSTLRAGALGEWLRVAEKGDLSLVRQALRESDPIVQLAAIQAVATSHDKDSTDAVVKALNTAGDARVRAAAARALTDVADSAVAEDVLSESLDDSDESVRAEVARALGRLALSGEAAARLMKVSVEDPSALVRENACYALAAAWPRLVPADRALIEEQLMDIASGSDVDPVRIAALYSLAKSGAVSRGERIVSIARSRNAPVELRKAAIEALGQLRMTSAVRPLALLARGDLEATDLRVAATAALGHMPSSDAGDALWMLSTDSSADIAAVARRAIEQGSAFSPAAAAAAVDRVQVSAERRVAATNALASSKDPRAIDPLIDTLGDPVAEVRESAVAGLASFKDVDAVSKIGMVLSDSSRVPRVGAAFALAAMDTDAARQILAGYAVDTDEDVRVAVAEGLGAAQPADSQYAALETLSRDMSVIVRTAAAVSLGRVENFPASGRLEELAKDDNADVRAAAVEALRMVRSRQLGTDMARPH